MRDTELISMVFTIGLPVLLAYLLMALRLFEVRYYKTNDKYSSNSKKISENTFGISIRDAALVTLALDISELLNNYTASLQEISSSLSRDLILITLLLFFHVTLLFFGLSYKRREYYENSKFVWTFSRLFQLYLALILLITNAVTIKGVMGAM